jgi:hypothetical protein
MNKIQNFGHHRYKPFKNSLASILLSEIYTKLVFIVAMGVKHGLPTKVKDKEGGGLANKFPGGKLENNREKFSKNVRRIKQIGLKLVLFARHTYTALTATNARVK